MTDEKEKHCCDEGCKIAGFNLINNPYTKKQLNDALNGDLKSPEEYCKMQAQMTNTIQQDDNWRSRQEIAAKKREEEAFYKAYNSTRPSWKEILIFLVACYMMLCTVISTYELIQLLVDIFL